MNKFDKKIRDESLAFLKKNNIPNSRQALNISVQPNIVFDKDFFLMKKFKGFNHEINGNGVEVIASKEYMLSEIKDFENPKDWFYHANRFLSSTILFLRITDKLSESVVLDVNFNNASSIGSIYILGEKNSSATIIINKKCLANKESYLGFNLNVLAKENSRIEIMQFQDYSKNINSIEKKIAKIEKNAIVEWSELITGGSFVKSDTSSNLSQNSAQTNIISCFATKNEEKIDITTSAIHNAKNTKSNINTRGLASGNSKALSQGLIQINKDASGSSGFEKQDALIISETAQADAIPNLEILNNDVQCSHSSSVGQIDFEKLFYLTSRGMTEDEAKKLMINGYFSDLIDKFPKLSRLEFDERIQKAVESLF